MRTFNTRRLSIKHYTSVVFFVAENMLIKVTMVLMVGVVLGRPDKDPIHMQHRVEVDQVDKQKFFQQLLMLQLFQLDMLNCSSHSPKHLRQIFNVIGVTSYKD